MDVHVGSRLLHGVDEVEIGLARVAGMDAALQAHFGGAALPRLATRCGDLLQPEVVGLVAWPRFCRPLEKAQNLQP